MKICSVEGCEKNVRSRGWCSMHYTRWKRHGDPAFSQWDISPQGRLEAKSRQVANGCTEWTGSTNRFGYGTIFVDGKFWFAHRLAYSLAFGEIPDGLVVDHICGNIACIKAEHLRAVTNKENGENRTRLNNNNSSGYRGVTFEGPMWRGHVTHNRKMYYCGRFPTAEEANRAVVAMRNKLHTHNDRDRERTIQ